MGENKEYRKMTMQWNYPGSKWWKVDFHTHTPASKDWRGASNLSPEIWLQYAMQAELDAVVVADHNSGDWIDKLKSQYDIWENASCGKPSFFRPLVIFPGVEITVNAGNGRFHILGIFDPKSNGSTVTAVMGGCGITSGFGDAENTSSERSFIDIVKNITYAKGLAIPAHIDNKQGLIYNITSLGPDLKKNLEKIYAVEVCNFQAISDTLKPTISRLANIAGSDAHKPEDIGRYSSWIKMSNLTIDELHCT
jgi:histidinol phosphatase-like PHP family hydrolase